MYSKHEKSIFELHYIYSACVRIVTSDVSILCDPWLFSSAYYGTWSQFPKDFSLEAIGDFDYIYISHIHPDHYCTKSLLKLFEYYGQKKILIADWEDQPNHLHRKMISDGFAANIIVTNNLKVVDTQVCIFPNKTGSASDIDSALLVTNERSKKSLLNLNDCLVTTVFSNQIMKSVEAANSSLELLCVGYAGAGPFPQTYFSTVDQEDILKKSALAKKEEFINRYIASLKLFPSNRHLPFAGKYILRGPLSRLNKYRGISDAIEVKARDQKAIVLGDGCDSYYDLENQVAFNERLDLYDIPDYDDSVQQYSWHSLFGEIPNMIPLLKGLTAIALKNALAKSECTKNCIWSIYVYTEHNFDNIVSNSHPVDYCDHVSTFNCNKKEMGNSSIDVHANMFIEDKALLAVLLRITHWNNYEAGSCFFVRRTPDTFIPEMHRFLNFFHI